MPHELNADQKKSFWSVNFSYFTQQWTIPQSDCDVLWKVDFLWQPVTTSSVAKPKRSSKAIPEAKLAPKKGHDQCLLVCCHSGLLQLSVPGETIRTEKYAQQIDEMHHKLKGLQPALVKRKGTVLFHDNTWQHVAQTTCQKLKDWATKFSLICHIHLTS